MIIPGRLGCCRVSSTVDDQLDGSSSIGRTSVRWMNQTLSGEEYPGSLVGMAKATVSNPAWVLASRIACRKEPAPVLLELVTVYASALAT